MHSVFSIDFETRPSSKLSNSLKKLEQLKHIQFSNQQNPSAEFDMVRFEELIQRDFANHTPFELHRVEFYVMLLIEEGQGTHIIDFEEYSLCRGSLVTIRKDQIHMFSNSQSLKGWVLLFTDNFLISYLEELEAIKTLQLFNEIIGKQMIQLNERAFQEIQEITSKVNTEYFDIRDEYSLGIIRSQLHILITYLYRIKAESKQVVSSRKYLKEFIEFQHLVEANVSTHKQVNYYAQQLGISTKTLNTITKSILNKSAKSIIDQIALTQIQRLLINTELSIKEIAFASGFAETTNFYKFFKRLTTVTPEAFRAFR